MRNENNGFLLLTHVIEDAKKNLYLLWSKHCSRFVKNYDVRPAIYSLKNFDPLFLANTER